MANLRKVRWKSTACFPEYVDVFFRYLTFAFVHRSGTWTLDLVDDFAGDSGTLVSWSLIMTPCCAGESGGGCMGDPHFKTWSGDWFDFHGMCDLVLLDHPTYDGGAGLSIDIRTKSRYQYSFIERVALKIGDDILEIGAWGSWIMNGISQGELSMLDNYPVAYEMKSEKEHKFRVELEEGAIVIVSFNDLLSVNIEDHTYKVFGGSQGMMGQYGTGKMLGRNGTTITDPDEFGNEWQGKTYVSTTVKITASFLLFCNATHPFVLLLSSCGVVRDTEVLFQVANLPSSHCVMPSPQNAEIRRLGESIGVDAAEKACAHWGNNKDLCVFDVLAMNDFEVAEHPMAGAF